MLEALSDSRHFRAAHIIILREIFYYLFYSPCLLLVLVAPSSPKRSQSDTGVPFVALGRSLDSRWLAARLQLDTAPHIHGSRTASRVHQFATAAANV